MKETDCEGNENKGIRGAHYWTGQGSLMSNIYINYSHCQTPSNARLKSGATTKAMSTRENGCGPAGVKMEPAKGNVITLTDKVRLR